MKLIMDLFLTFVKIGLFTFGGGYAMISMVENSCVERKKWITHDEMMAAVTIAESTPGPIAINAATFVGFRTAGMAGAIAATIGVVLPSFIIIYIISMFLDNFMELTIIANAFKGIKLAVGLLILQAGLNMARHIKRNALTYSIMAFGFASMLLIDIFSLKFSSIALMLMAAAVSLAAFFIKGGDGK